MPQTLHVHFLPALISPNDLADALVVVIDVLRASTTITQALQSGAKEVIPTLEVEEAQQVAAGLPADQRVLGGERGGVGIEGFDLSNSPCEYTPSAVGGKTVVFTTTNGTKAMQHCRQARRVLVGAFVNAAAMARELMEEKTAPIQLLCAGTRGEITREDVLFAGLLVQRLAESGADYELNDQALMARESWQAAATSGLSLAEELANCLGGRNLKRLGLQRDLADVAQLDSIDLTPALDVAQWRIRT